METGEKTTPDASKERVATRIIRSLTRRKANERREQKRTETKNLEELARIAEEKNAKCITVRTMQKTDRNTSSFESNSRTGDKFISDTKITRFYSEFFISDVPGFYYQQHYGDGSFYEEPVNAFEDFRETDTDNLIRDRCLASAKHLVLNLQHRKKLDIPVIFIYRNGARKTQEEITEVLEGLAPFPPVDPSKDNL